MSPRRVLIAVALATAIAVCSLSSPVAADQTVAYAPPVPGEIVDGWRPPSSRYGAGNRGIDLAAREGDPVRAAATGEVVFAGRIGAASHVVVLHADGIRTSYSFLRSVTVRRGERVEQGAALGTAAGRVHFGARVGDEYLDPTVLLGSGPPAVHLVPTDLRHPLAAWQERRNLVDHLAGAGGAAARAAGAVARDAGGGVSVVGRFASRRWRTIDEGLRAVAHALNVGHQRSARARRADRVLEDQRGCTPRGVDVPRPRGRRIAVLVAGLGSSSDSGAVLDIDTDALGYGDGDVAQFSYAGGQATSAGRHLAGIPVRPYDAADTWNDLERAGERLRTMLVDIAAAHPGVPVDLLAHSQGGIVARAALDGADAWDPRLPAIGHVVTLGTPHHGAVLATAANIVNLSARGRALLLALQLVSDGSAPAAARSTQQLASFSRLIESLGDRSLPAGTPVTSISASGDRTVDWLLSSIDHATNVRLDIRTGPAGTGSHDRLPGHPATQRELALALAGMPPGCAGRSR